MSNNLDYQNELIDKVAVATGYKGSWKSYSRPFKIRWRKGDHYAKKSTGRTG